MPTTTYTVINGQVLSENRNGVKRDYVPDPLGSTLALLDNTQAQTDTFTYWPYGEVKSRTGTTATPFQFVGTQGYYQDSSTKTYVRARYLDVAKGRWMTQDPIGFAGGDWNLYGYVGASPLTFVDPSGKQRRHPPLLGCPDRPPVVCFWCLYNKLATGNPIDDIRICNFVISVCHYTGGIQCPPPVRNPNPSPRCVMRCKPPTPTPIMRSKRPGEKGYTPCSKDEDESCGINCKTARGEEDHFCSKETGCQCGSWPWPIGAAEGEVQCPPESDFPPEPGWIPPGGR